MASAQMPENDSLKQTLEFFISEREKKLEEVKRIELTISKSGKAMEKLWQKVSSFPRQPLSVPIPRPLRCSVQPMDVPRQFVQMSFLGCNTAMLLGLPEKSRSCRFNGRTARSNA